MILNDAESSVFIEDPSENTYLMDGQGNINVNAPKNFTLNAGANISETAGLNHSSFAGAMMMQNAVADYSLMAANIMEVAQGERKSRAKDINENAQNRSISSQENTDIHTQKTFNNNSGEKSKSH